MSYLGKSGAYSGLATSVMDLAKGDFDWPSLQSKAWGRMQQRLKRAIGGGEGLNVTEQSRVAELLKEAKKARAESNAKRAEASKERTVGGSADKKIWRKKEKRV